MRIEQNQWTQNEGWQTQKSILRKSAQLVLVFGATRIFRDEGKFHEIKSFYPNAHIVGCSTAGEIYGTSVTDGSLTTTAVFFEKSNIEVFSRSIEKREDSAAIGQEIGRSVNQKDLVHVFVVSDGLNVNGSALVEGIADCLPRTVSITGGLAADYELFAQTFVICDKPPQERGIAAVCFYGGALQIGCGSFGGWDPFGPERIVTRSNENILYELDGKSALDLYKTYLGDHAKNLPASALLFPLGIRLREGSSNLVRTILSINAEDQGMVFAGDVPEGAYARFMKANLNRLIDGAADAARISHNESTAKPDLAILISCVGRKMVLKQRVEEEIESVRDILGNSTAITGFYSYGEIAPAASGAKCELHNQTMTITTIAEKI